MGMGNELQAIRTGVNRTQMEKIASSMARLRAAQELAKEAGIADGFIKRRVAGVVEGGIGRMFSKLGRRGAAQVAERGAAKVVGTGAEHAIEASAKKAAADAAAKKAAAEAAAKSTTTTATMDVEAAKESLRKRHPGWGEASKPSKRGTRRKPGPDRAPAPPAGPAPGPDAPLPTPKPTPAPMPTPAPAPVSATPKPVTAAPIPKPAPAPITSTPTHKPSGPNSSVTTDALGNRTVPKQNPSPVTTDSVSNRTIPTPKPAPVTSPPTPAPAPPTPAPAPVTPPPTPAPATPKGKVYQDASGKLVEVPPVQQAPAPGVDPAAAGAGTTPVEAAAKKPRAKRKPAAKKEVAPVDAAGNPAAPVQQAPVTPAPGPGGGTPPTGAGDLKDPGFWDRNVRSRYDSFKGYKNQGAVDRLANREAFSAQTLAKEKEHLRQIDLAKSRTPVEAARQGRLDELQKVNIQREMAGQAPLKDLPASQQMRDVTNTVGGGGTGAADAAANAAGGTGGGLMNQSVGDSAKNLTKMSPADMWEWAKKNKNPLMLAGGAAAAGGYLAGGGRSRRGGGGTVVVN